MRTSIRKPNPNRDPKESYKLRTLIPLGSQQNLERPRLVARQADGCEEPPKPKQGRLFDFTVPLDTGRNVQIELKVDAMLGDDQIQRQMVSASKAK